MGFHPEGVGQFSPGQRPGNSRKVIRTLKGCDNARASMNLSHPFRVRADLHSQPGALPRAKLSHPFGVNTPDKKMCRVARLRRGEVAEGSKR